MLDAKAFFMVVFAPVAVLAAIQVILLVISRIGGWHALARRFPDRPGFAGGETWRFRSLKTGIIGAYNNIVTIQANRDGLRFSLPLLFQTGHQPIFIPWKGLKIREESFFGLAKLVRLTPEGAEGMSISLPHPLFTDIVARTKPWLGDQANAFGAQESPL